VNRSMLAGVIGGLVIFVWGAFSHMVLPLGGMGLDSLPNEAAVVSALSASIPRAGLYMFPADENATTGPWGMVNFHPDEPSTITTRRLVRELLGDIAAAVIAVLILSRSSLTRRGLVVAAAAMGLFGWFSISFPYWNWYGFPAAFVLSEAIDQAVGWALAGAAMSFVITTRARSVK